jgi:hypothetical protein
MKSYDEVISRVVKQCLSKYFGGYMDIFSDVDIALIEYIYEVPSKTINKDIKTLYKTRLEEHYKKYKK